MTLPCQANIIQTRSPVFSSLRLVGWVQFNLYLTVSASFDLILSSPTVSKFKHSPASGGGIF